MRRNGKDPAVLAYPGWRETEGVNESKQFKHGGEHLCPDCIESYERGGPSGVALGVVQRTTGTISCRTCGKTTNATTDLGEWVPHVLADMGTGATIRWEGETCTVVSVTDDPTEGVRIQVAEHEEPFGPCYCDGIEIALDHTVWIYEIGGAS